jgi:hypothetical protein
MPAILKIYSTKHAAPKRAIKHSTTEGQLPKSNHNNMKKIVEIRAKKCYNASSSHDCYGKIKFTVVAVNTLTLPLGLTHSLIFCWNSISINSFDRVLQATGIQLTSQECETPVYHEWVSYSIRTPHAMKQDPS